MTAPPDVTRELSRFVCRARWEQLPDAVRHEGKRSILNFIATALAGCREDAIEHTLASLMTFSKGGQATVIGRAERLDALSASFLNAASGNVFDFDDTHLRTVIHPTAPVAPALFALAEMRPVGGLDLLLAFALGVEVKCRLGNAISPEHYARGWHITSTCGVFGAAAAAGRVLYLKENEIRNALAFAATQASGTVEVLGSMARVLNAGFAARNGIASARLAREGFEGPPRPIEGLRGFVNVFGGNTDFAAIDGELGSRWDLKGIDLKPYPCGVVLHALIDACLEMKNKNPTDVQVKLNPLAIERTDRPQPRDGLEARLSAQHAVAVALVRGRAGLAEFSQEALADPQVLALRKRVRVVPDPGLDKMEAVVSDGRQTVRLAKAKPMDDARLEAKLRELAGAQADAWLQLMDKLETAERVVLP